MAKAGQPLHQAACSPSSAPRGRAFQRCDVGLRQHTRASLGRVAADQPGCGRSSALPWRGRTLPERNAGRLRRTRVNIFFLNADMVERFVSPHRSEDIGLNIAEAMRLEKPVIATDYSGSTDFHRRAERLSRRTCLARNRRTVRTLPCGCHLGRARCRRSRGEDATRRREQGRSAEGRRRRQAQDRQALRLVAGEQQARRALRRTPDLHATAAPVSTGSRRRQLHLLAARERPSQLQRP